LKDEDRKKLRFGIRRKTEDREVFIENVFSRVTDIMHNDDTRRGKFIDIATLPVTEVVGINL
jgi:hypothetical protein